MKLAKVSIMLATVALLSTGCSDQGGSSKLIEKPQVTVENGEYTPEVLNAFGRVSDVQVSPDGKQVLYGITYMSVEQNKGNRELWVMDIDGQNAKQLTKTPNSESNAVWMDEGPPIESVSFYKPLK